MVECWKILGSEQVMRAVWEYFTLKRAEAKNILEDAARERREGIHGQRQQEPLFSEILEQVRGNVDGHHMMRKGFIAMRGWQLGREQKRTAEKKRIHQNGPSRKYAKLTRKWREMKLDVWVLCSKSLRKSTDFLRRIIAAVCRREGVNLSYVCPHCNNFSGGLHLVGVDRIRRQQRQYEEALQLVVRVCVEATMNG